MQLLRKFCGELRRFAENATSQCKITKKSCEVSPSEVCGGVLDSAVLPDLPPRGVARLLFVVVVFVCLLRYVLFVHVF